MEALVKDKMDCCGCTACMNSCPKNAITMQPDADGFLYPAIDFEKCIDCGICQKVCDFKNREKHQLNFKKVFALQHNSEGVLKTSTSGGAFTAISDVFLERGAVVFGALLDDNFDVYYVAVRTKEERDKLKGSKYVQSDLKSAYKAIKELLSHDTEVMFVGTPCQVSGLYSYIGKDYSKLFTLDFICRGTPSLLLLKEHIKYLENKYNKKAISYKFRDKKYGWIHTESVRFSDGVTCSSFAVLKLMTLFYSNLDLRPSCYVCKYANLHRDADITIGDYWGVEKVHKIYDNNGTSLLIVNSDKGDKMLSSLAGSCKLIPSDIKLAMQRGIKRPVRMPENRDEFWKLYHASGYSAAVDKYGILTPKQKMRTVSKRIFHVLHIDKFIILLKTNLRKNRPVSQIIQNRNKNKVKRIKNESR